LGEISMTSKPTSKLASLPPVVSAPPVELLVPVELLELSSPRVVLEASPVVLEDELPTSSPVLVATSVDELPSEPASTGASLQPTETEIMHPVIQANRIRGFWTRTASRLKGSARGAA